jgi:hypothetical protein
MVMLSGAINDAESDAGDRPDDGNVMQPMDA